MLPITSLNTASCLAISRLRFLLSTGSVACVDVPSTTGNSTQLCTSSSPTTVPSYVRGSLGLPSGGASECCSGRPFHDIAEARDENETDISFFFASRNGYFLISIHLERVKRVYIDSPYLNPNTPNQFSDMYTE